MPVVDGRHIPIWSGSIRPGTITPPSQTPPLHGVPAGTGQGTHPSPVHFATLHSGSFGGYPNDPQVCAPAARGVTTAITATAIHAAFDTTIRRSMEPLPFPAPAASGAVRFTACRCPSTFSH